MLRDSEHGALLQKVTVRDVLNEVINAMSARSSRSRQALSQDYRDYAASPIEVKMVEGGKQAGLSAVQPLLYGVCKLGKAPKTF